MSTSLNQINIIGNVARIEGLKDIGTGTKVFNFSIATSEKWKNKQGEDQESTEFHSCVAYMQAAEICDKLLTVGRQAFIQGKLQTRSWDKDGVKHYKTEVKVEKILALGAKPEGSKNDKSNESSFGDFGF